MEWLKRWRRKEQPLCPECGRPQTLIKVGLVSGVHGEVEFIFRGMPVLSCGIADHPQRFAMHDFGVHVIDAIFWRRQVPLGQPGRLARLKCLECGKNVYKEPRRPSEVAGLLEIGDLPQFGVRIKGPVVTCPRCETNQLWATREIGQDVSSAMVEAFKEADVQF